MVVVVVVKSVHLFQKLFHALHMPCCSAAMK